MDAVSFAEDADRLNTWKQVELVNQRNVLERLVQQIVECCRFMRAYADNQSYCIVVSVVRCLLCD